MKTAAKVFIILGMIFGFFMIFPIVIGIFALKKLEEGKKEELLLWSILTLFLCSFLGGIFMLIYYFQQNPETINNITNNQNNENQQNNNSADSLEKDLDKLNDLKNKGLITEEEYESARKATFEKYTK